MINEKSIFLFDGIGALVSIFLLGVVLPAVQPWIGMPLHILYILAILPCFYAVYSLSCFWLINHRNPIWLKAIMVANSLYCVLTFVLVMLYFNEMTIWGIVYFFLEAIVIIGIVLFERRVFLEAYSGR